MNQVDSSRISDIKKKDLRLYLETEQGINFNGNGKGLCGLCSSHYPTLQITVKEDGKQYFYCSECGKHGSLMDYLSLKNKWKFGESLRYSDDYYYPKTKKPDTPMSVLDTALMYRNKYGFSVIPVLPSKKPLIQWEKYQRELASEEEIKGWFTESPNAMVGIVTGKLSNLIVVDVDTVKIPDELMDYFKACPNSIPTVATPRGFHYWFKYREGMTNTVRVGGKEIDIRAEGGYCIVPPSNNGNGGKYTWQVGLDNGIIDFPKKLLPTTRTREDDDGSPAPREMDFTQGVRDEDLFHTANTLVRGGMPEAEIRKTVAQLAKKCDPPFSEAEAQIKVDSAINRAYKRDKITEEKETQEADGIWAKTVKFIENEVDHGEGFTLNELSVHLGYSHINTKERETISKAVCYLIKKKKVTKVGKLGTWKRAPADLVALSLMPDEDEDYFKGFRIPLLEEIKISRGDVLLVGGYTSAGKTAFALNFVRLNQHLFDAVDYFSTQSGQVRRRILSFQKYHNIKEQDWKMQLFEREGDFATVINPTHFSVIDFISPPDGDYSKSGNMVSEIHNRIENRAGVVLIFAQKPPQRDAPYGGAQLHSYTNLSIALDDIGDEGEGKMKQLKILKSKLTPQHEDKVIRYKIEDEGTTLKAITPLEYPSRLDTIKRRFDYAR